MKWLILLGGLMITSTQTHAKDIYEIVSFKFQKEVSLKEQKEAVAALNHVVKEFKGFKSRNYYYSEENQRWFDFITWESLELAKKASEQAMKNPQATKIFSLMDEKTMIFSHYERMGGL